MNDGKFQIVEKGKIGPFMCGYGYLLVERELANFLEGLGLERAVFKDALIYDPVAKEEIKTHLEIVLNQHFSSIDIRGINLDGDKLLMMDNQYIFVTPSLKDKLTKSEFSYLKFSEGLSEFAG